MARGDQQRIARRARPLSAFLLAALAPAPVAAAGHQSAAAAVQEAAAIAVPFDPPLGQVLRYRYTEPAEGGDGDPPHETIFTVEFERSDDALAMTMRWISQDDELAAEANMPRIITDRRFRVGPTGILLGMDNEPAYWTLTEAMFAHPAPGTDPREAEASMRDTRAARALPRAERMMLLALHGWPVTYYAGVTYRRAAEESTSTKQTVLGPIEITERTALEGVTDDNIRLVLTWTVPRTLEPPGATRTSRTILDLDRRTGLLRRSREERETVRQVDGRTVRTAGIITMERIDQPR
jgi:hypothetical protein